MSRRPTDWFQPLESRQLFSAALMADTSRLIFSAISGDKPAAAQVVTLTNSGDEALMIDAGGESIDGSDADEFSIAGGDALPLTLQPGQTASIAVQFSPTRIGPAGAVLHVIPDDPNVAEQDVVLRGLGTKGLQGDLEPSLQWILDTYQIPVNVGDSDSTTGELDLVPVAGNDEVQMNLLAKAGPGPVTIDPIAVYSNPASPALTLGSYNFAGGSLVRTKAYDVAAADVQTLAPHVINGSDQFDPGSSLFGLFTQWAAQKNRLVYTEDFRNTWQKDARLKRSFRFYPLKDVDGNVVPNAYVVGVEEATNHDYQDGVFIIRNVRPAAPLESPTALTASAGTNSASLKWTNNSGNEAGFSIERATNGGAFTPVATVPSGTTRYTDPGLTGGNRYQYRVQAVGPDGATDYAVSGSVLISATYQAEAAGLAGATVQKLIKGYTGTGYAAFTGPSAGSIHWQPTLGQAGNAILTFRYLNRATAASSLKLTVNGTVVRTALSFAPTGTGTAWKIVTVTVPLLAGINDVLLTSAGATGAIIDSMQVH